MEHLLSKLQKYMLQKFAAIHCIYPAQVKCSFSNNICAEDHKPYNYCKKFAKQRTLNYFNSEKVPC